MSVPSGAECTELARDFGRARDLERVRDPCFDFRTDATLEDFGAVELRRDWYLETGREPRVVRLLEDCLDNEALSGSVRRNILAPDMLVGILMG